MIGQLIKLATKLDADGFAKEAAMLDGAIEKMAEDDIGDIPEFTMPANDMQRAEQERNEAGECVPLVMQPLNQVDDLWSTATMHEPNIVKRGGW